MSLPRVPEPKTLAADEEARAYHAMDHSGANTLFVDDLMAGDVGPTVIDLGCGPAAIPIELCLRDSSLQVLATDAEIDALELAKLDVEVAGLLQQITLEHVDVCKMDHFDDGFADTVISNSMIHHLDQPEIGIGTAVRLLKDGGRLFIRDLYRPATSDEVESIVEQYAGDEDDVAQQLFRQSLHASLTLREIQTLASQFGVPNGAVKMTSDRHWTVDWTKPRPSTKYSVPGPGRR